MIMTNFVTHLTEKDYEEFIHATCEEVEIHNFNVYVCFSRGGFGPRPEFMVDDFNFKGINSYSSYDYSAAWRKFLYKKFGKDYEAAVIAYAEEESSKLVNSIK